MDQAMRPANESPITLKDYIQNYRGHEKICRLTSIIEAGIETKSVKEDLVVEAIQYALDISASTKALGLYFRVQSLASKLGNNRKKQFNFVSNHNVNINYL